MHHPIEISKYISLVTDEPIDEDVLTSWYKTVSENAPDGVVTMVQTTDDKGERKSTRLIHRETKKSHYYIIPLTRDLHGKECEKIVNLFCDEFPELDFDIEATVVETILPKPEIDIDVQKDKLQSMALAMAKKQHDEWMKARLADDWRYGQKLNYKEKVHPLLRPWHELPARFRNVDEDGPQKLLNILGEHGYAVVSKSELESLLRIIRSLS